MQHRHYSLPPPLATHGHGHVGYQGYAVFGVPPPPLTSSQAPPAGSGSCGQDAWQGVNRGFNASSGGGKGSNGSGAWGQGGEYANGGIGMSVTSGPPDRIQLALWRSGSGSAGAGGSGSDGGWLLYVVVRKSSMRDADLIGMRGWDRAMGASDKAMDRGGVVVAQVKKNVLSIGSIILDDW
jgi:hypothetical protein